jgi:RNA polymerase sigma-70 factor (ECF subfamily)
MHTTPTTGTDALEHLRPRLFGIAYRMLGDPHDAEEVVQEAFLRWHQGDRAGVVAPEGWLVAVVTRLAIDRARRAATERRAYAGPWLPAPIATGAEAAADRHAELASDLSMAFLVLLERLAPEERAAFLLRELFDADYATIARALGRGEAACRQLVHRARERVRQEGRRVAVAPEAHRRLLRRFLDAVAADDQAALLALFDEAATYTGDGGGRVRATRRVVRGADRVARLVLGVAAKFRGRMTYGLVEVNGEPAVASWLDGRFFGVASFATDGERIAAIYQVLNPDKLDRVSGAVGARPAE